MVSYEKNKEGIGKLHGMTMASQLTSISKLIKGHIAELDKNIIYYDQRIKDVGDTVGDLYTRLRDAKDVLEDQKRYAEQMNDIIPSELQAK